MAINDPTTIETLKKYHQFQYDRIDNLGNQRYNFGNLILTLTTRALTFEFKDNATDIDKLV